MYALQASQCVQLMQEYFPDSEVQTVAEQLEAELREVPQKSPSMRKRAL